MTPAQIALVRSSFDQVLPISEQAAEIFYARLFELAPQVRVLFKGDMQASLGPAFTAETREAWATAYGTLSSVMIAAADAKTKAAA
jgi:hemoglobin-like flavoprotein